MAKLKEYSFSIGNRIIDIEAKDEKAALLILVEEYWDNIDNAGQVELCGIIKD